VTSVVDQFLETIMAGARVSETNAGHCERTGPFALSARWHGLRLPFALSAALGSGGTLARRGWSRWKSSAEASGGDATRGIEAQSEVTDRLDVEACPIWPGSDV